MRTAAMLATAVVAAITAGCASRPALSDEEVAHLEEPLECDSKTQCDLLWRRTQAWIAQTSGYKLQVATDTVIETYNAGKWSTTWAFQALREPIDEKRDRINLVANCGSAPLCTRSAAQVIADFRRAMRTAR